MGYIDETWYVGRDGHKYLYFSQSHKTAFFFETIISSELK